MIFAYLSVLSLGWSIAHNNNTLQNFLFFQYLAVCVQFVAWDRY